MKQALLFASALLLAGVLFNCKNNPGGTANAAAASEIPQERPDSMFGIKGCDRAGFKPISATEHEFIYQDFTVHISPKEEGGENIRVIRTDSATTDLEIVHEEPTIFAGAARGQILLEEGTGPENQKLVVYHVKRKGLMFRMAFCGDMEVTPSGNVRFYTPTEASEVPELPDCPDKEKWEKQGLKVGYGQLCLFSLVNRSLTRKSEYICVPLK